MKQREPGSTHTLRPHGRRVAQAALVLLLTLGQVLAQDGKSTYRAAVYAHKAFIPNDKTPVSRSTALDNMEVNLVEFRDQAAEAKNQGVEILIFPEDGIYGFRFNRETIFPYLEYMPDPKTEAWNPCDDPTRYNDTEVQKALSCMAKENKLYLVANIGDKQPCDPGHDPACPSDKRYQYNTNVAYSPDGTFLAKYHKHNLFYEDQFNTPAPQHAYFDTPFGRFGMMTCFDILFEEPGIPLVEKFNVTNIAFPTAWMDALPIFPAIGYHSSFARAHGVNFLAANIHHPEIRFDGTGLYGPSGSHGFYYGAGASGLEPRLVVGDMEIISPGRAASVETSGGESGNVHTPTSQTQERAFVSSPVDEFSSKLFEDTYTFRALKEPSEKLKVCQGKVCCELDYKIEAEQFKGDELFAFGAFDGLHTHEGSYYLQNCALVKCADASNRTTCGSSTTESTTVFTKVSMQGYFQTSYVYPQLISSDSNGKLGIYRPGEWNFNGSKMETTDAFNGTVLNALLVGRDYSRDSQPVNAGGRSHPVLSLFLLLCNLVVVGIVVCV